MSNEEHALPPDVLVMLLGVHAGRMNPADILRSDGAIAAMLRQQHGLIKRTHQRWVCTERGVAYVALLCRAPFPAPANIWTDPRTGEAINIKGYTPPPDSPIPGCNDPATTAVKKVPFKAVELPAGCELMFRLLPFTPNSSRPSSGKPFLEIFHEEEPDEYGVRLVTGAGVISAAYREGTMHQVLSWATKRVEELDHEFWQVKT